MRDIVLYHIVLYQIFLMFERLDQKLPKGGEVSPLKHFKIIIGFKTPKHTLMQIFIKI